MNTQRDKLGIIVALILTLVSVLSYIDTLDMVDSDSYVFPRAIAITMFLLCVLFILMQFIKPSTTEDMESTNVSGSTPRRMGLFIVMLCTTLLMSFIGFVFAGLITFGLLMLLSMYDEWTFRRKIIYSLSGIVIVTAFYLLFAQVLQVPLPSGDLFSS